MKTKGLPSPSKAKEILKDGEINGRPLTPKQKRLFGMIAAGRIPSRLKRAS